jgi:hypothetical protein
MVNPVTAILSDIAGLLGYLLVCLIPAVVAFWKGRGPWMVWSLAMALLTLPTLLIFGMSMGDPFHDQSFQRWLVPLCVWLAAWFFAKVAINERIRDEQRPTETGTRGD